MKARIKKGSIVGQDFGTRRWKGSVVFDVSDGAINGRVQCTADGYGSFEPGENYGDGAIYAKESDLIPYNPIDKICDLVIDEAKRRMKIHKYQDRNAAIHEVLMEVGLKLGEVMRDENNQGRGM